MKNLTTPIDEYQIYHYAGVPIIVGIFIIFSNLLSLAILGGIFLYRKARASKKILKVVERLQK